MRTIIKRLRIWWLIPAVFISATLLSSCSKDSDSDTAPGTVVSSEGNIIINGKPYRLMPSEIMEMVGGWNIDSSHPNQGVLYIWWIDEKENGCLETFTFQSGHAPQVGDDLSKMSLKHTPANELFDHSEAAQATWPKDWYSKAYWVGDYVSGTLTVVNIEGGGTNGYLTVQINELKTRNYIGEEYTFNGTVKVAFDF